MNGEPVVATPSFAKPIPILRILDEAKAREFYVDFLGFVVDFEARFEPGTPLYMQISKDACVLQLSEHFGDGTPGTKVKIPMRELRVYNAALLAKKYKYARPGLHEQSWGQREMPIQDPFGNTIIFSEPIDPPVDEPL